MKKCAECGEILEKHGVILRGNKKYCSVACALKKGLKVKVV